MPDLEIAARRLLLLQQNPQKRRLADTVRTDDTDALAALDVQIDMPEQFAFVFAKSKGLGKLLCQNHIFAGREILLKADFHPSLQRLRTFDPLDHVQTLFAGSRALGQMLCTMLLHLADHLFLSGDLPLLVVVGTLLCLAAQCLLCKRLRIVSLIGVNFMMLDFKNAVRDPIQKIPVVGNDHDRALIARQILLEPFECTDIQMVGRLVEE